MIKDRKLAVVMSHTVRKGPASNLNYTKEFHDISHHIETIHHFAPKANKLFLPALVTSPLSPQTLIIRLGVYVSTVMWQVPTR